MRIKSLPLLIVLLLATVQPVQAQLLFSLNPAGQTGLPGQTITFNATLTNAGPAEVFLNGDHASISVSDLFLDDTPFFDNFPLSLPSSASATADIFRVTIAGDATPGVYQGTFTVVGGADAAALDDLAAQNFQVRVAAAAAEPGAVGLLSVGMVGLGMISRTSKRSLRGRPSTGGIQGAPY